jgi:hypothetical protein
MIKMVAKANQVQEGAVDECERERIKYPCQMLILNNAIDSGIN